MVMEVLYTRQEAALKMKNCCIALGFFDGFHLGHQQLLEQVRLISSKKGLHKAVMTFHKHPRSLLEGKEMPYISSLEDKIRILQQYGFDYLWIIDFDSSFSKISPEKFIQGYILPLPIKEIVCGFDYHFGYLGKGDSTTLASLGQGNYTVHVASPVMFEDHKISSTYIKQLLKTGDMALVTELLDRPYTITGRVIHGYHRGEKELRRPTANICYAGYVLPLLGVYAVTIQVQSQTYKGMANIGYNPTFGDITVPSLEVAIFDFQEDIYDCEIAISFYQYIRAEKAFETKEKLRQQLRIDFQTVQNYFKQ